MGTTKKTKAATSEPLPSEKTKAPTGPASYWHIHKVGPVHSGTVKGDELKTACGKTLHAKYWRAMPNRKVDCDGCEQALGKKTARAVKAAKVVPEVSKTEAAA